MPGAATAFRSASVMNPNPWTALNPLAVDISLDGQARRAPPASEKCAGDPIRMADGDEYMVSG
ncbi:hypothetical protein [Tsukamurella tyrosinosolvens]|uniref:hypothetical protein n=1 Tax=Tsukamurella tyrosinosolvens TaxID=57704 RepID=UPI000DF6D8FD|nr:hypothetical protein [Tsukamurella tyrosinosolvens]RDB48555.1 hypothetical protein DVB87_06970 [Tsukamurella tyrosinosolvens]